MSEPADEQTTDEPTDEEKQAADEQRDTYVQALQREREHYEKYGMEAELASVDQELARVARDAKPARKRAEKR